MKALQTVAVVNNAISAELLRQDMAARGIALETSAVILARDVFEPWMESCAEVVRYPGRPAQGLFDQRRFFGFYCAAANLLKKAEREGAMRIVYIPNNDNLITAHLLSLAARNPLLEISVIAEGLMNFQDIGVANRQRWRWIVKPAVSVMLGLRYREPKGHLSGAFDAEVSRVVSFAAAGLKAPPDKVVLRPFKPVEPRRLPDPNVALVALTGLDQWMDPERSATFARAFASWIKRAGFRKVQIKKHPRVSAGLIEELLADAEEVGRGLGLEAMAEDLEAGTILGSCCTALVTLKLIRPDLECIDFGSNYYCEHAYHGDRSVQRLFAAAGVKLEQMAEDDVDEFR